MRSTAMTAGSGRTSVAASDVPIGSTGASTTVTSGEIARTDTILRVAVVVVIFPPESWVFVFIEYGPFKRASSLRPVGGRGWESW